MIMLALEHEPLLWEKAKEMLHSEKSFLLPPFICWSFHKSRKKPSLKQIDDSLKIHIPMTHQFMKKKNSPMHYLQPLVSPPRKDLCSLGTTELPVLNSQTQASLHPHQSLIAYYNITSDICIIKGLMS